MLETKLTEQSLRLAKDFAKDIRAYLYAVSTERILTEQENKLYATAHEVHIRANDALLMLMNENSVLPYTLNEEEQKLVETLEEMKKYCKGELELDLEDGVWTAMDYREDLEQAFLIEKEGILPRIMFESDAKKNNIDVRKCCDVCNISYVG